MSNFSVKESLSKLQGKNYDVNILLIFAQYTAQIHTNELS